MSSPADPADPAAALAALAGSTRPYLIGVRHHSPSLAVAMPHLLTAFAPDVVLIELPSDFAEWLPYLADPATRAPVALAGVVERAPGGADGRGSGVSFYPFADFSPELAALSWAAAHQVPVRCCDLPLADPAWADDLAPAPADQTGAPRTDLTTALERGISGRANDDMWDRRVEARAPGADPEQVRRAALAVGWAMRHDVEHASTGVGLRDLRREAQMRATLASVSGERVAMVVGAFHAPALLEAAGAAGATGGGTGGVAADGTSPAPLERVAGDIPSAATVDVARGGVRAGKVTTSLVPYTFPLLDSRSGYPAGIRDPEWQQLVFGAGGDPELVRQALTEVVVRVCGRLRAGGHPAGPGEAREAVRLAEDLARLRGLPAPARGELIEALQTVLAQGENFGRARFVAKALQAEAVGSRRGKLAPGTPDSGLAVAVRRLVADLKLPGPGDDARDLRLDPLRSDTDRAREVALTRLRTCDLGYGEQIVAANVTERENLTSRWRVHWTPRTDAMLTLAATGGVTLAQATEGALRERHRRRTEESGGDTPSCAQLIVALGESAECGLPDLAGQVLGQLVLLAPQEASLAELVRALMLVDRIRLGHIAGLPPDRQGSLGDLVAIAAEFERSAIRQIDGLAGSDQAADARGLATLAARCAEGGTSLRLAGSLRRLTSEGSPLIAAAATAVEVLLELLPAESLGDRVGSWIDTATTSEARRVLRGRLSGLLTVGEPLLHTGGEPLDTLSGRIETLSDDEFIRRLPTLRAGFAVLTPAGRSRLAGLIEERLSAKGARLDLAGADDPATALVRMLADRAGREALARLGLTPGSDPTAPDAAALTATPDIPSHDNGGNGPSLELSPVQRWKLVLGQGRGSSAGRAGRLGRALDELYGSGGGEGANEGEAAQAGGGQEPGWPSAREWSGELAELFGERVREEVLAVAVESGRIDAALELGSTDVRPSIELLQGMLSIAGGLPEAALARLRPLVARIVAELTRELATRLRPALTGVATPRPTARPGGPLDLRRTVAANLARSHRDDTGKLVLIPDQPVFKTRSRKSVDWRLVLVVDVSGSMEPSVIWSALTAAVLAGIPALTTHFVAFSTEVVDLSERVSDPLSLLLEVKVGGGTHIAAGLRYAQSLVTVPSRTLVIVVSDFEEGFPLGGLLSQTRNLAGSGVRLLGCAALDDKGAPRYSVAVAQQLVAAGMPVAALSPLELARWVGEQIR